MKKPPHSRITILVIILLFALLTFVLQRFALNQFYALALDREAKSVHPKVEILLQEIDAELMEENLMYIDLGLEELIYNDIDILRLLALRTLEIPDVSYVNCFDKKAKHLDLATNVETKAHDPIAIQQAKNSFASVRLLDQELSIIFPIGKLGEIGFLELGVDAKISIIKERMAIKHQIISQGLFVFLVGSVLLFFIFELFLSRLKKAENTLIEKSESLRQANKRLSSACKSAGLGAISAHLFHAIKSPLMGLKNLDLGQSSQDQETAVQVLRNTTQKIESLIHETLNSLREHELDEESYSFEVEELLSITANKFNQDADDPKLVILSSPTESHKIDNLKANLLLPILQNLVQNGLESGPNAKVFIQAGLSNKTLDFLVIDNGSGISDNLKEKLFSPMQSSKSQGSGIGLAICKELAAQMNARIFLKKSSSKGSTFCVELSKQ